MVAIRDRGYLRQVLGADTSGACGIPSAERWADHVPPVRRRLGASPVSASPLIATEEASLVRELRHCLRLVYFRDDPRRARSYVVPDLPTAEDELARIAFFELVTHLWTASEYSADYAEERDHALDRLGWAICVNAEPSGFELLL